MNEKRLLIPWGLTIIKLQWSSGHYKICTRVRILSLHPHLHYACFVFVLVFGLVFVLVFGLVFVIICLFVRKEHEVFGDSEKLISQEFVRQW